MVENKGNEQHIKMFPTGISHFEPLLDLKSNVQQIVTVLLWEQSMLPDFNQQFYIFKSCEIWGNFIFS